MAQYSKSDDRKRKDEDNMSTGQGSNNAQQSTSGNNASNRGNSRQDQNKTSGKKRGKQNNANEFGRGGMTETEQRAAQAKGGRNSHKNDR